MLTREHLDKAVLLFCRLDSLREDRSIITNPATIKVVCTRLKTDDALASFSRTSFEVGRNASNTIVDLTLAVVDEEIQSITDRLAQLGFAVE